MINIPDNSLELFVILVEPDIPQNTGNIARLCHATGTKLVLVRPLGFRLTDKALQRAGMDYWKELEPLILNDMDEFKDFVSKKNAWYFSAKASKNYSQVKYSACDCLVFGCETTGLDPEIITMANNSNSLVKLPMKKKSRCINVSSAVAAATYEALRQIYSWSEIPSEF